MKKNQILSLCLVLLLLLTGCQSVKKTKETVKKEVTKKTKTLDKKDYGLLTGMPLKQVLNLKYHYNTLIISKGTSLTKEETQQLYNKNTKKLYTAYSLSKSPDKKYTKIKGTNYIDITHKQWIQHITKDAYMLKDKGFFGVYLSGLDLYKVKNNETIYNSITNLLEKFYQNNLEVIVTDGQTYVETYLTRLKQQKIKAEEEGQKKAEGTKSDPSSQPIEVHELIHGIFKEEVFTIFDEKNHKTIKQDTAVSANYKNYFQNAKNNGLEIYIVEFTRHSDWQAVVRTYCRNRRYHYYFLKDKTLSTE